MVEPLVMHQIIEYRKDEPFYVDNITGTAANDLYVKNSHVHGAHLCRGCRDMGSCVLVPL